MATQSSSQVFEQHNGHFVISTDPHRLDIGAIHRFLSHWSSWETEGIPHATVERAIRNSLNFGMYEGERQIGFARVVTDYATFAFILDDYIEESHRGRGLGKWLMHTIQQHPDVQASAGGCCTHVISAFTPKWASGHWLIPIRTWKSSIRACTSARERCCARHRRL